MIVSVTLTQHRDHVVGGDDAGEPAVRIGDGQCDEVVLVEELRHFVVRRVRCAGDAPIRKRGELSGWR
jgi:hypothetical protein